MDFFKDGLGVFYPFISLLVPIVVVLFVGWVVYKFFLDKYPGMAVWLYIFFVICIVLLYMYSGDYLEQKELSLISGMFTGLVVLMLSIFINYHQVKAIDRFKALRIIDILKSRDDEEYYREIIKRASSDLWILGVTANRFLDDFANQSSPHDGKKLLISKIDSGMKVRLLLADINDDDFLGKENHRKAASAKEKLDSYPDFIKNSIECRYYSGKPTQSIFYTENDCLVGPVFPSLDSQHTPCIHLNSSSTFVKSYLTFFESQWESARRG